jgi:2-polyprenyl-3-methyl-5-hydroxy-6-metoxy-1,4-benzoquinol methylase
MINRKAAYVDFSEDKYKSLSDDEVQVLKAVNSKGNRKNLISSHCRRLRIEIQKNTKNIKNILDIGFGGGDSIKMFANYYKNQEDSLFFYGVDLKEDCIEYATKNLASISNNKLICDNYKNIGTELLSKIDVIHCSLFLHHLTDDEIIDLFKFIKTNKCILLVNDLHRNWLAYYSIKFLTMIFSKSYLVKNDAPLSVLRGFKKDELTLLLKNSGFTNYEVNWNWAFRYSIIAYS